MSFTFLLCRCSTKWWVSYKICKDLHWKAALEWLFPETTGNTREKGGRKTQTVPASGAPPPGQPRTMVGKPLAQQLRVEHRKAEGGQPEEENSHCRKKASPTCREHPFSVLACPMVIFRRKRSLVSTTGRKQITHSIDKCDWSRRPMLRK
jgi:hypothetical protein